MRHVVGVLAVAACLAGLVSEAAAEELTATATMSPETIVFPVTKEVTSRLEVRSGDEDEVFVIEVDPPLFEHPGAGFTEGSPYGSPRFELEGAFEPISLSGYIATIACSPVDLRTHGYEPSGLRLEVRLPARSSGAVVVRRPFGEAPWPTPWPATDLRERFRLTNNVRGTPLVPVRRGTLERERFVQPPAPKRAGSTGVQIHLTTTPATGRTGRPRMKVQAGTPITVKGWVSPPVAGARIELRYYSPENDDRELRTLAHVEVDDGGGFKLEGWRPRRAGYNEVWAYYEADRPGVVDDFSCPRVFELEGDYRPPEAPGVLRVRSSSTRLTGLGAVPLRITCTGGRDCDAKVALETVTGRRLSRRRVVLGAGLSQRVFFPLKASRRRALLRAKRLEAVAETGGARRPVVLKP